jgi:hypothetical protein
MVDYDVWKTLGKLEASNDEQSKGMEKLFLLLETVQGALTELKVSLETHIAIEEVQIQAIKELTKKVDSLEHWKDRGLFVLGAASVGATGIGAGLHGLIKWLFGGGH